MKRTFLRGSVVIAILIALMVGQSVLAESQYTIIDLGTLGGTFSNAQAINDNMQIVGGSDTASGDGHAFLWENGVMTDLGTLGGLDSHASAINNLGQVIGSSQTTSGDYHAFLWENDVMTDLGTLGGSFSQQFSINDLGQVVGMSETTSGDRHAFLWENGVLIDLGTLGGNFSRAAAINNHGQIVGDSDTASGDRHAFLWKNGVMTDLGMLTDSVSCGASVINDNQQVVGSCEILSGERHAFVWENGVMTDLGVLADSVSCSPGDINEYQQVIGSCVLSSGDFHAALWMNGTVIDLGMLRDFDNFCQPLAINDQMQIVGSSGDHENWEVDHAFLWEDGSMIDLGTLGGDFATAFDINSNGQIVGFSTTSAGEYHAVLWTLPPTPTIPILDDFDREDGRLGPNWAGYKSAYRILGNQVNVQRNGPVYWKDAFGIDQQVAITLSMIDTDGFEQDLLLKVQGEYGPNWGDGVIEVLYSASENTVTVWTFLPDTLDWFSYPAISASFTDGDQFGAQALATGDVVIFKNGTEVGRVTLNSTDQRFFNAKGGHIGLWFINARNAFLDDFSGGDVAVD